MSADFVFTKENLDACLSRLAKEFRRLGGAKVSAEIVLIGGAAVLARYGFREMTHDVDALIRASASMKDAVNRVGDELGLPNGWLNSDFTKTSSYSPKLLQYSDYYKRFGYVLEVRTVSGEYLVAMKLKSGRPYKNDLSDVVGILREEKERGKPITLERIRTAVCNLYGSWDALPQDSRTLIAEVMRDERYRTLYEQYRANEQAAKASLLAAQAQNPDAPIADNLDEILRALKKRKEQE